MGCSATNFLNFDSDLVYNSSFQLKLYPELCKLQLIKRENQSGIEYASTFTWTRVAQSVKTTYEKLVGLHLSV